MTLVVVKSLMTIVHVANFLKDHYFENYVGGNKDVNETLKESTTHSCITSSTNIGNELSKCEVVYVHRWWVCA